MLKHLNVQLYVLLLNANQGKLSRLILGCSRLRRRLARRAQPLLARLRLGLVGAVTTERNVSLGNR